MIELTDHPEGTVVAVVARPGSRRPGVLGERDGALLLAVSAPPDKGKANAALAALLAETLGCKASAVRLIGGPASRRKRFLVEGRSAEAIRDRLRGVLSGGG
ncbi:DUF167 domain-containing protein [Tautonia plasticadhaerens]|uniref:UPF0235 protein ElP_36930 n=1 Tax=Tautonia plasticadhaerens TaxID=2527974 RepID=A0A518H4L4_9BACT|nr:DUF167 domain-containing protein [Tautonia plasticadhaerens]QDV35785.1 hypothetical protein ElP_36930 [Tautonia plasticadhaerens]